MRLKSSHIKKHNPNAPYYRSWREKLFIEQQGICEICGKHLILIGTRKNSKSTAHLDHDHESGVFRGILCKNCNSGLGGLHDDQTLLLKAILYLKKWSKIEGQSLDA